VQIKESQESNPYTDQLVRLAFKGWKTALICMVFTHIPANVLTVLIAFDIQTNLAEHYAVLTFTTWYFF
jgi:hypothetical protein